MSRGVNDLRTEKFTSDRYLHPRQISSRLKLHMDDPIVRALSRAEALERTTSSGTILCLGSPPAGQQEFGIDLQIYAIGPRFGGIKMVPAGLHLVTWGTDLSRCGVFIALEGADVSVMQWDQKAETLVPVTEEEVAQRHAAAVRRMEHDATLGPYPLATEPQWRELCGHISVRVLRRALIPVGALVAPSSMDAEAFEKELEAAKKMMRPEEGSPAPGSPSPPMAREVRQGCAPPPTHLDDDTGPVGAAFVTLDPRASGRALSGAALSRFHLDKSEWLAQLLASAYDEGTSAESEAALLGELELAYLLFLRLSCLRSLEQWKALVHLLLGCDQALREHPGLFSNFIAVLRAQLALAPHDVFESELTDDNFLRGALAGLADRTGEGACQGAAPLPPALTAELQRLWAFLEAQFSLTVDSLRASVLDEDDQPVVVLDEPLMLMTDGSD